MFFTNLFLFNINNTNNTIAATTPTPLENIAFNDLVQVGTMTAAKEKGLVRLEGKEYVVKDGDVILFRFNV